MFFTYFFPKLINPRKAATINRDPDPTKTVQFLHMKKAGRDSLRNKMLKINKINKSSKKKSRENKKSRSYKNSPVFVHEKSWKGQFAK